MNSLQIKYFIKAVACGSFSAAAKLLYVSQPAVTKQISAMEQELGFPLFTRLPAGVSLTPAGHIIYDCLSKFTRDLSSSIQRAKELSKASGYLSLGLLTGMNFYPLQERIRLFSAAQDNLVTDVIRSSVEELLSGLYSGSTDTAILFDYHVDRFEGISCLPLYTSRHVIVVSQNHPLAGKSSLSAAELSCFPFIFSTGYGAEDQSGTFGQLEQVGRMLGIGTESVQFCPNFESVLTQLEMGNAITIMDENVIYLDEQHFRVIPTALTHQVVAAWKPGNPNPYLSALLSSLKKDSPALSPAHAADAASAE